MSLHNKLTETRRQRGLTQEELAEQAHVTVRTIQRIESGESQPRPHTMKAIAAALGTDFADWHSAGTTATQTYEDETDREEVHHFVRMFCLSCFSYLVIPYAYLLIPQYMLSRRKERHPEVLAFCRATIQQQVNWLIALNLLMLLILAYNLASARYFGGSYVISYLLPFYAMYGLNAFLLRLRILRIPRLLQGMSL